MSLTSTNTRLSFCSSKVVVAAAVVVVVVVVVVVAGVVDGDPNHLPALIRCYIHNSHTHPQENIDSIFFCFLIMSVITMQQSVTTTNHSTTTN